MNRNQAFAAAALVLFGSSAFAGDEFNPQTGFAAASTTVSAAQVRAEAQAARRNAPLNANQDDVFANAAPSVATRADVKAELADSRVLGPVVDPLLQFQQAPTERTSLTREEVRAATRTALAAQRSNGS